MPRSGSGIYTTPPGTDGVPGFTIESSPYNVNVHDVETDLNLKRPIIAGGTGASTITEALVNLHGEMAYQVITNYDSDKFHPGSFKSDTSATGGPVPEHAFAGICYLTDNPPSPSTDPPPNTDLTLEARDYTDPDTADPGIVFIRQKKAGVWGEWKLWPGSSGVDFDPDNPIDPGVGGGGGTGDFVLKAGDTMTGNLTIAKEDPALILNKPGSGTSNTIAGQTAGINRWTVELGDSTAEGASGGGTGDPLLATFDDPEPVNTVVTGSGLTATRTAGSGYSGTRSTMGLSSDKHYFEMTLGGTPYAGGHYLGIILASAAGYSTPARNQSISVAPGVATTTFISSGTNTGIDLGASSTGDVFGFAIDLDARLVWVRRNAGNWNASSSANPATGVGGFAIADGSFVPWVGFTIGGEGNAVTANFGQSAFAFTPPSGFNNWSVTVGSGAESGSDFVITRYADDGTPFGGQFKINRKIGYALLTNHVNAALVLDTAGNGWRSVIGTRGLARRFQVDVGNSDAESGGNAGSNFAIIRYSDGDALIDTPLLIVRSSGTVFIPDLGTLRSATKPGGGMFADVSDTRIKNITGNYTQGLAAIQQLNPRVYTYKGNDVYDGLGASPHAQVIDRAYVGLVAQEVEGIMPETVSRRAGTINGAEVTDLRVLDMTPLVYALVNTCKELAQRIEALEAAK